MKEYIIITDAETGKRIGKIEVRSKVNAENVAAFIVNETILIGYAEFDYMQELAKDLPDLGE
jgi:hypothetical protein